MSVRISRFFYGALLFSLGSGLLHHAAYHAGEIRLPFSEPANGALFTLLAALFQIYGTVEIIRGIWAFIKRVEIKPEA